MALPATPSGYSNWNDYIKINAPALAASEGITLQEAKASLKLLYVSEPVRQAIGTPSYRIYNVFTTWAARTVSPTIGRPWVIGSSEYSFLTTESGDFLITDSGDNLVINN